MTHLKLFSPNFLCQWHVPGGKDDLVPLDGPPADEGLEERLKLGLLRLRCPLLLLLPLSFPLNPPRLTKFTSASSSLNNGVKGDAAAIDEAVGESEADEVVEEVVTWLTDERVFSVGRP